MLVVSCWDWQQKVRGDGACVLWTSEGERHRGCLHSDITIRNLYKFLYSLHPPSPLNRPASSVFPPWQFSCCAVCEFMCVYRNTGLLCAPHWRTIVTYTTTRRRRFEFHRSTWLRIWFLTGAKFKETKTNRCRGTLAECGIQQGQSSCVSKWVDGRPVWRSWQLVLNRVLGSDFSRWQVSVALSRGFCNSSNLSFSFCGSHCK